MCSSDLFAAVRFQTISEYPDVMRLVAMGRPMVPNPINPTRGSFRFIHTVADPQLSVQTPH